MAQKKPNQKRQSTKSTRKARTPADPKRKNRNPSRKKARLETRKRAVDAAQTSTKGQRLTPAGPVRLNKAIARAGVCSRRAADDLIQAGRVTVNGETVTELGTRVSDDDRISVNGREIQNPTAVYILLNKPRDTISTVADDRGRRTVIDLIGKKDLHAGLFPVGRLDRDTTGLLILTNDGDLANRLMHPKWEIQKIYVVQTDKAVSPSDVERLRAGVVLDDGPAAADHVDYFGSRKDMVALQLHEGRNRQVRRMLQAVGYEVISLDRIRYAGLGLENVRRGHWRHLTSNEVNRLQKLVRLRR